MYGEEDAKHWTAQIRDRSYGDSLLEVWRAHPDVLLHVKRLIDAIDPYKESRGVLDLGCGTGQFLYALHSLRGYDRVIGVNLFKSQLDFAVNTHGMELQQLDIRQPFRFEGIDLAFLNHVSGHLTDEEISHVLKQLKDMGVKRLAMWEIIPRDISVDEFAEYKMRSSRHWVDLFHDNDWGLEKWAWYDDAVLSANFIENTTPDVVTLAQRTTVPVLMVVKPRETKEES